MESKENSAEIITFLSLWDENIGPIIKDSYPPNLSVDLEQISEQIFQSFQSVFGSSSDVKYEKTDLVLPLKSYKKVAKILLDSFPNESVRGGLQPFFAVVLLPESVPVKNLSKFDSMLLKITRDFKLADPKDLSIKEYTPDFISYTLKVAHNLRIEARDYLKIKKYETAIEKYKNAIEIAKTLRVENINSDFFSDLNKAYIRYAQNKKEEGDHLFSEEKYDKAINLYKEAIDIGSLSNNVKISDNFTKNLSDSYIKIAQIKGKEGDDILKTRNFRKAHEFYSIALSWAKLSKNFNLQKKFEKKLNKTPNIDLN